MSATIAQPKTREISSSVPDPRLMRAINPLVRGMLRSPLRRLLGEHVLLLTYTGRISGRQYTLPVGYTRDDDTLTVISQHSASKRWWRNLRGGARVTVDLQGARRVCDTEVIEEPTLVANEVERMIVLLGAREASARLFMKLDTTPPLTHAELVRALDGVVIVRLTTTGLP